MCLIKVTSSIRLEFFGHRGILRLLEILLAVPDCAVMGG